MISYHNDKPLTFDEIINHETKIYHKQLINTGEMSDKIDLSAIYQRKISKFRDNLFNIPQNIFILEHNAFPKIVGRKIISNLYFEKKINAINCSQINASMILGILKQKELSGNTLSIRYYPLTDKERNYLFNILSKDVFTDIIFPFNYIDFYLKKEKECKPKGWSLYREKVINLSNGEKHFRDYTNNFFKNKIKDGDIIYDPACSTGTFLSSIKEFFSGCKTIGQDLSEEMTEYAKDYVDEIYTGNALDSPLPEKYVDIMFLRFLNSEIVTTSNACMLFDSLEKKVKQGGFIVLFGHTPVLLKKEYFINKKNYNIIHQSGFNSKNNTIFQYYVLQKN